MSVEGEALAEIMRLRGQVTDLLMDKSIWQGALDDQTKRTEAAEAEVARLRSEVERLTREHAEFLRTHSFDAFEKLRADRDAALRERDEARAAIDYAMSERAAALAESAALRARLAEAERLLREAADVWGPLLAEVELDPHENPARQTLAQLAAFLAADPKEGAPSARPSRKEGA